MPLYEYECTACHRRTEKIQKFSDAELTICPFCKGPLERTLTAPAVHFAGGGWYKDGYGSSKPPAAGGEEKSAEGKPGDAAKAPASGGSSGDSSSAPATPAASPSTPSPSVSSAPKTGS